MPGDASDNPDSTLRQWVEPMLTKHDSLAALTRQDYGAYPPGYYPPGHPAGVFADSVPGSGGFFVS